MLDFNVRVCLYFKNCIIKYTKIYKPNSPNFQSRKILSGIKHRPLLCCHQNPICLSISSGKAWANSLSLLLQKKLSLSLECYMHLRYYLVQFSLSDIIVPKGICFSLCSALYLLSLQFFGFCLLLIFSLRIKYNTSWMKGLKEKMKLSLGISC